MICDSSKDYYNILGINENASANEVKKAYYRQAKLWHPDKNASEETAERFKLIQRAYEVLSSDSDRFIYDTDRNQKAAAAAAAASSSFKSAADQHSANRRRYPFGFGYWTDYILTSDIWRLHHHHHHHNNHHHHHHHHSNHHWGGAFDPFGVFYDRNFFEHDYYDWRCLIGDTFARFDAFVNYLRFKFATPFRPNWYYRQYRSRGTCTPNNRNSQQFQSTSPPTSSSSSSKPETKPEFPMYNNESPIFPDFASTRRTPRSRIRPSHMRSSSVLLHMCRFCGRHSAKLRDILDHEKACLSNPEVAKKSSTEIPVHHVVIANNNNETQQKPTQEQSHVTQVNVKLDKPEKYTCRINIPVKSTINIVVN